MTKAEKLRFLADRIEDEKEFDISHWLFECSWVFKYQNGVLMQPSDSNKTDSSFMKSPLLIEDVLNYDLKAKQQKEKIQ